MTLPQIGQAIRAARGTRSVREVAATAGIKRDVVGTIERGETGYTMTTFLKLCDALGGWEKVFAEQVVSDGDTVRVTERFRVNAPWAKQPLR